jgi:hypothetical protein
MRVVDLADEFGLTTAETLELCERAGISVAGGGDEVTEDEASAIRQIRRQGSSSAPPSHASGIDPAPAPAQHLSGPVLDAAPAASDPLAPTTASPSRGARSGAGSQLAVFGVAASLLGLCVPIIPALVGIALGTIAKQRAKTAGNAAKVGGPATAAQVIGTLFLVGWVAWFGWSYRSQRTTVTLSDKTEVQVRKVPFTDVQKTDCLVIQPQNAVEELWVTDCSEPHDAQILTFHELSYVGADGEDEAALAKCQAEVQHRGLTDQNIDAAVLIPPPRARTVDQHHAICIIEHHDKHPFIGRL